MNWLKFVGALVILLLISFMAVRAFQMLCEDQGSDE
jgi:hypothetical protein